MTVIPPEVEDDLAAQALDLVRDMRDDLAQAHRTVRSLERMELEQLCCVLAAAVPTDMTWAQLAWWRVLAPFAGDEAA